MESFDNIWIMYTNKSNKIKDNNKRIKIESNEIIIYCTKLVNTTSEMGMFIFSFVLYYFFANTW